MISEEKIRIYNKTLEPNIWDKNQNLKPEIRLDLLKIANDFYKSTDFKTSFIDILLLGSSVNYTWTPESDIDVHIVFDIKKEGLDTEHYRKTIDSMGSQFNLEHNIKIHGHKVEVYLQDITEKNSTPERVRKHGAMFSLLHDKWLVSPKFEKFSIDKEKIKKKFYHIKDKIDHIIEKRDVEALKTLMKSIRDYRNKGLESGEGEFSTENIVFKALRHTGILEKLKNNINSIYDRLVSLEEMESYLNKINNLDEEIIHELIEETISELEEKDKPYILIGAVDEKSQVAVIKVEKVDKTGKIQPYKVHKMLYYGDYDIDPNTSLSWRYRSDINELIYYDYPSELQSISVKNYLRNEYKVTDSPKVVVAQELNRNQRLTFHDLNYKPKILTKEDIEEVFNNHSPEGKNFIVTGQISHDLDIAGESYWDQSNIITHGMIKSWYGNWADSIDWRYRDDEHTVYYKDREPSDIQKEIIFDFLKEDFGVIEKPKFKLEIPNYRNKSHYC